MYVVLCAWVQGTPFLVVPMQHLSLLFPGSWFVARFIVKLLPERNLSGPLEIRTLFNCV
jgi:hypothetical protein